MPWGAAIAAAATIYASSEASNAAEEAANAQKESAGNGLNAQKDQFNQLRELLNPYAQAGQKSLFGQQDLIGQNGFAAQQNAINGIQNSAQFQALNQQGQNAILQNASATGGLRGGNTQAALGQFSPQLLNQLINEQYSKLGGLTSIGQNAAAGVGNAGMAFGQQANAAYGQMGAAEAGSILAQQKAQAGMYNGLAQQAGAAYGQYQTRQQPAQQAPAYGQLGATQQSAGPVYQQNDGLDH